MIDISNSILNQKGTPAIYSGNYDGGSGLPSGIIAGRVFIDSSGDNGIYQQNQNGNWTNICVGSGSESSYIVNDQNTPSIWSGDTSNGSNFPSGTTPGRIAIDNQGYGIWQQDSDGLWFNVATSGIGVPNLQQVLDAGNSANNDILIQRQDFSNDPVLQLFRSYFSGDSAFSNGNNLSYFADQYYSTYVGNQNASANTFGIRSQISLIKFQTGNINVTQGANINAISSYVSNTTASTQAAGTMTLSHAASYKSDYIFLESTSITNFYNFLIDQNIILQGTGPAVVNNWGIYQRQIDTNNFFGGKVVIGSNVLDSNILKVVGNTGIQGYLTTINTFSSLSDESVFSIAGVAYNEIPAGASYANSGYSFSAVNSSNVITFAGSATFAQANVPSSIFGLNQFSFSSAGSTITLTQAAGGVRAFAGQHIYNTFAGSNSGTITHLAGLQIYGLFNISNGSTTPVINNMYQLLINDTGDYGHTFTFTNKWGIYQAGTTDNNYLAGDLLLGTQNPTGRQLVVNGSPEFLNAISGSAGGNSGQHLIVFLDGVQYKIKLENP